jgi:hypothetical protein
VIEFTCWNGDVVRVAFALDSHDLEVISWVATETIAALIRPCCLRAI